MALSLSPSQVFTVPILGVTFVSLFLFKRKEFQHSKYYVNLISL